MCHSFCGDDDCDGCARVAALIRINLSIVVVFVVIFVVFVVKLVVVVVMLIVIMGTFSSPPTTITTKTNIPITTTALHTHRYGTFGDGGNSGFGWVLMLVVVMVGFCWS